MISSANKISKSNVVVPQKTTTATFFKKSGEGTFFGKSKAVPFIGAGLQKKASENAFNSDNNTYAQTKPSESKGAVMPTVLPTKGFEKVDKKVDVGQKEIVQKKENIQTGKITNGKIIKAKNIQLKLSDNLLKSKENCAPFVHLKPSVIQRAHQGAINNIPHTHILQQWERGPPETNKGFQKSLALSKGTGSSLPEDTRVHMENRMGGRFEGVRIHTGRSAETMSRQIGAQAFTHEKDIYFNAGKYNPNTYEGKRLLAHELTHTLQQGAAPVKKKEHLWLKSEPFLPPLSLDNIDFSGRSGGAALPAEVSEFLQDHFKTDVSDIRIHTDSEAARICSLMRVKAFTKGSHILFAPSQYAPATEEGGLLLAREVAQSFKQRSIKTEGGIGALNEAAKELKKEERQGPASVQKEKTTVNNGTSLKEKGLVKGKKQKFEKGKKSVKKLGKKGKGSTEKSVKGAKKDPKKSPSSPDEDPAFQKVIKKTITKAKGQKQHEDAGKKAAHAQKAATAVPNEAQSKAQKRKTEAVEEVAKEDRPFDAAAFKADLLKKIEAVTPKNLEEANEFKEANRIGEVKEAMGQKVGAEKDKTAGPVKQAQQQPLQVNESDNKKPEALPPTPKGKFPGGIGAKEAAPKPKLPGEISMEEGSASLDEEMKANNVTEDQLEKSNEPSFITALKEKKAAQKDAKEKPVVYKKGEALMLKEAKTSAEEEATKSMAGMFATRGKNFDTVVKQQHKTKSKDEEARAAVVQKIESIYLKTEGEVNRLLTIAETTSTRLFDEGAEKARLNFENYVSAEIGAYKRKRYSGFWGGLRWGKDKLFGMPDAVNKFYVQGRERYLSAMDAVITQVATAVTTNLTAAKEAIKKGKKEIADFVNGLSENLKKVGEEAAENIADRFDALESSVNDKRDQLIDGLAQKYVANLKKLDDRITELKEANKGLVQKAIGLLKEVWKVIKNLYQLFKTILSRIASVIGLIISDPGAFFSNLGKAFKQGFDRFQSRIGEHLENGLMIWLSTQLGVGNLKLPPKFDIGAIFNLVLQVLGVSPETVRERAVLLIGEKKVAMMEKGVAIFKKIQKEGLGAAWDMLVEKLTDFKDTIWEAIKSFIRDSVIKAAITFLLSLLNPVAAFVKACMAIYDFVMMLVRMKDRIIDLLNAILDAVALIASGAVDKAAAAVENAFAKSIPIIIGFLAALLHLNDIGSRVRGIITRIRDRIFKVIDWVLQKIYNGAKVLIDKMMGRSGSEKNEQKVESHSPEKVAKIEAGLARLHKEKSLYLINGKITRKDANLVASVVKKEHPVFSSFVAKDKNNKIEFLYTASPLVIADEVDELETEDKLDSLIQVGTLIKAKYKAGAWVAKVENIDNANKLITYYFIEQNLKHTTSFDSFKKVFVEIFIEDKRLMYMGTTPDKRSDVGRKVIARMRLQNLLVGEAPNEQVLYKGKWYHINECDMSHIVGAAEWWSNLGGRQFGSRSEESKAFMNDASNYILEPSGPNRGRGSKEPRYLPPLNK